MGLLQIDLHAQACQVFLESLQGSGSPAPFRVMATDGDDNIISEPRIVDRLIHALGRLAANAVKGPIHLVQVDIGCQRAEYAANNVAKRSVDFFVRLSREQLRPTYGQGFRGAPLQTDTEESRPQTIRAGGSRAQVTQTTSEGSRSEEEI